MQSGVYAIKNKQNGKVYIGSGASNIRQRWRHHLHYLRKNNHGNSHLQAAWNHYGESEFQFSVLELCDPEHCIQREQYWIDTLKAANREFGYNAKSIADSALGTVQSEETKLKKSLKQRGRPKSTQTRLRMKLASIMRSGEHKTRIALTKYAKH